VIWSSHQNSYYIRWRQSVSGLFYFVAGRILFSFQLLHILEAFFLVLSSIAVLKIVLQYLITITITILVRIARLYSTVQGRLTMLHTEKHKNRIHVVYLVPVPVPVLVHERPVVFFMCFLFCTEKQYHTVILWCWTVVRSGWTQSTLPVAISQCTAVNQWTVTTSMSTSPPVTPVPRTVGPATSDLFDVRTWRSPMAVSNVQ